MRNGLKNCTFLIDRQCIKRCFFKKLDFLNSINNLEQKEYILSPQVPTIAHVWCDGHSTSTKFLWSERQELRLKVSRKEFYTYIHLDYIRVEFLFCIKKKIIIIIIKGIITWYSTMSTSLKELVIRSNNQPSKVLH